MWCRAQVIRTCPLCFSPDDVSYERMPDGVIAYSCERNHDGNGDHHWTLASNEAGRSGLTEDGVTDELLDPFSACVLTGEPWMEYGIIELRFRDAFPDLFRDHVRDRGHRMLNRTVGTASGTRFAMALGRLAKNGEVIRKYGPATGAWAPQNLTYWARSPTPPAETVTWSQWCTQHGRPDTWTDEDRACAK